MENNQKLPKFILVVASIALISAFTIFVLEKAKVTNFYNKPIEQVKEEPRSVNDVIYTPASTTEQEEGEKIKQDLLNQPTTQNSAISISLSAAGQDEIGGPLIVKAIITGTSTGKCYLSLKKDSVVKEYEASLINLGTYFGCDGFSVPISDLSVGKWNLSLRAEDKSISQEVEIKK